MEGRVFGKARAGCVADYRLADLNRADHELLSAQDAAGIVGPCGSFALDRYPQDLPHLARAQGGRPGDGRGSAGKTTKRCCRRKACEGRLLRPEPVTGKWSE